MNEEEKRKNLNIYMIFIDAYMYKYERKTYFTQNLASAWCLLSYTSYMYSLGTNLSDMNFHDFPQ